MESSYMCDQHGSSVIAAPLTFGDVLQTGVFSATVAAFLVDSYKSLQPDPTDVSSRLLQQITQELAGISNGDRFTPPTLDTFRPPRRAIHVNILWFLSLCLSLACGLGATLVQQWLRRYIRLTQHSDAPLRRVRMRAYLWQGFENFHVHWVVENISVMLHAAIFLFFVGLCEFLFTVNDEVAEVVVVAVSILAAIYFFLTLLPAISPDCPFQTPLTSLLWYIGHFFAISFRYLSTCSCLVRAKVDDMQEHLRKGPKGVDKHLMSTMGLKPELDKYVLETTLSMCRGEDKLEAFVDAIPGCLQADQDVTTNTEVHLGTPFLDIAFLLKSRSKESSLRHRLVHLLASCTSDHRRMDDKARRRRALICCRAVWEISRASLSDNAKGVVAVDFPKSIRDALQHLTSDTDSVIRASALRTVAIFTRAFPEQFSDAERRNDPERIKETVAAPAEVDGGMNDLPILSYQSSQRSDERPGSDQRLNTVTKFTSNFLELIPQLGKPSHMDLEETTMTLEEICRELNGREFSHDDQQRLVDVLNDVALAHTQLAPENVVSTGKLCP